MKRSLLWTVSVLSVLAAGTASAEHLELGLAAGPSFVTDKNFEAFSSDNLALVSLGADLRTQVGSVSGFEFVPMFSYRFGTDTGDMYNAIDTELFTHDFRLGLRVRKDIISWLGVFAEAYGGVLLGSMSGQLYTRGQVSNGLGLQDTYEDKSVTWTAGGKIGAEAHLSRKWLESKNIYRFCFGGEVGVGYDAHGVLDFDPTLSGGGENAIATETLGSWGGVNTSAIVVQLALSLYFF